MIADDVLQFLGGYFHEDWPEEAADETGIIQLYLNSLSTSDEATALAEQLVNVANDHIREARPDWLFWDYGCYFDPTSIGLSGSEWLYKLAELLRGGKK